MHVQEESWKNVLIWVFLYMSYNIMVDYFIRSLASGKIVVSMALSFFSLLMLAGGLSILSKSLTQLFHFKITFINSCKIVLMYSVATEFMPLLSTYNRYFNNAEAIYYHLVYWTLPLALFFLVRLYVRYKWLKVATIVYFVLAYVFLSSIFMIKSVRNSLDGDNEIKVFSDLGKTSKKDISEVKKMVEIVTN
jgi:uncharacterized membrane protein